MTGKSIIIAACILMAMSHPSSMYAAEQEGITPKYAFVAGDEKAATAYINDISKSHLPKGRISIDITGSDEDLIDSMWYVDAVYYSKEAHGIIVISVMAGYTGKSIVIDHVPFTAYSFEIGNDKGVLCRTQISVKDSDTTTRIHIAGLSDIGGDVSGLPVWSAEDATFRYGAITTPINAKGHFAARGPIDPDAMPTVQVTLSNPFKKEYLCPAVLLMWHSLVRPVNANAMNLQLPALGDGKLVICHISLSPTITDLDPKILTSVEMVVRSSDRALEVIAKPDRNGTIIVAGLPDGHYIIEANPYAKCLPFRCVPHEFDASHNATHECSIELLLRE
jgi:hypothetical protein